VRFKIHVKLTLTFFGICLLILLSLFLIFNQTLPRILQEEISKDLKRELRFSVWTLAREFPEGFSSYALDKEADAISRQLEVRVTLIGKDGTVLGDSELDGDDLKSVENHRDRPEVMKALSAGFGEGVRYSRTVNAKLLYVAAPLGNTGSVVRLALPLSEIALILFHLKKFVVFAIFLSLIASLGLGYLVSLRISKPIRQMARVSQDIARGDYSKRMKHVSQDEVGELATALNQMASQVEANLRRIEEEKQRLQAILFGMVEGVMVTDQGGRIILVNPAFQELFELKELPSGRTPLELLRNRGIQDLVEEAALSPSALVEKEISLSTARERTFLAHAIALLEGNALQGIVSVFHDITNLKRLENLRREFVANVSHELKTPLTSIKGYTETLLEGALEDASHAREFTQAIYEQSERLGSLIDDLLDLSRIESGRMELRIENFELKPFVQEVLRPMDPIVEKKRLKLENRIPGTLTVKADPPKVRQILMNLLDNAVKYTPEKGEIVVEASPFSGGVQVKVQDTGIGIPEEDLSRLFERFYRVDKARSRELGGTGLGLAIVKHLVQAHGGKVWVESILGKGSTFYFTLPAGTL